MYTIFLLPGRIKGAIFLVLLIDMIKNLIDDLLEKWYFQHYSDRNDSSFGHDIADPFSAPYIKYHRSTQLEVQSYHKKIKKKIDLRRHKF
jgi:hypothetical protein